MEKSLPIKRIHHVELIVGNALQAAYFYRKALGFDQVAYLERLPRANEGASIDNVPLVLLSEYAGICKRKA